MLQSRDGPYRRVLMSFARLSTVEVLVLWTGLRLVVEDAGVGLGQGGAGRLGVGTGSRGWDGLRLGCWVAGCMVGVYAG